MKRLITLLSLLIITQLTFGQLSGDKYIQSSGGDYTTIAAAVTDLNAHGVGGSGVTFHVEAGHTESITAPISITATGTAATPIIFQKNGAGVNPKITAYVGTASPSSAVQDGIWNLVGSDYVTIDGIDLFDPNSTNPATMEYGYAFFKANTSDGCQYNTIKNCNVSLSRVNNASGSGPSTEGSKAINVTNALVTAQVSVVTVAAASGSHSYNKFYSNTLQNCNYGVVLSGYNASSPYSLGDTGNDIGGNSSATGNTILNFGGASGATNPAAGVRANYQWGINISFNTLNNNNGSGANHPNTLRGIYGQNGATANVTINNNTITLQGGGTSSQLSAIENAIGSTAASNTVSISNNIIQNCTYTTATTGILYCIYNTSTAATVNITNNVINNLSLAGTSTTPLIEGGSPPVLNISGNSISNISRNGASGTTHCIKMTSPANVTINGNTVDGVSWTNTTSTGSINGIYGLSSSGNVTITNNIVRNLNTPTTGGLVGIREWGSSTGTKTVQNNQVYNFSTTTGGAGGGSFAGIYLSTGNIEISNNAVYALNSSGTTGGTSGYAYGIWISGGTTNQIFKNNIYNLSSTSTNPVVAGINVTAGTTNTIYNNFISDLRTPAANAANPLIGINVTGGTTDNIFYNTVFLNGTSSGALFGSTGLFVSTSPTVDLRNNLIVNISSPNGLTGYTVAYRRATTTLTSYGANSNNNDFYAGTPGTYNLIFFDGTNARQTMADYKSWVAPRDANSFSENPPFEDVAVTPYDLHIQTDVATQCESGGVAIGVITDDFDGNTRQDPPDVGADEFEGTPLPLCDDTPATAIITGADEVCYNTSTTLELSIDYEDMGITYQWGYSTTMGGPYTNLGTDATQSTGNLTETAYYVCTVTCTYTGQFMTTAEFTVSINPLPTVQVTPTSGSYCNPGGTPVQLTASGAVTYSWSPADGLDNTSSSVVNASPPSTTTYTVTGYDENGCSNTANVTVTVGNYPIISSVTATPDAICPNGTSQLNVLAIGPGPASQYSFAASGGTFVPITGGTTVPAIQADDVISGPIPIGFGFNFSGNNYGTVYASSNGFLSFNPSAASSASNSLGAPSTSIIPLIAPLWDDLDGKATGGSTASYLVSGSTGNRIFTFEWLNWEWYWNATSAVISFQVKLYETDNHIEFIYRQEAGNVVSGSASIGLAGTTVGNFLSLDGTGISPNASSTIATNNLAIKPASGQVYSFFLPVYTGYTYLWSPAAGLTPDATVPNPTTPSLAESTQYTVTVFNGDCSVQESVWVNLAEPLTAAATSPERCTADITTPITGSHTGGSPDFTFTWSPVADLYVDAAGTTGYDGSPLSSPTIYTKTNVSGTTYNLLVTDNCATTATAVSTVTVYQTPNASAASNGPVCSGETLELYGTTDLGTTFEWTGPNGFTSGLLNPTIPDVTTAASGTYYFTATANDCPSATASVTVVVNQTPSPISVNPATSLICPGSVQQLNAVGGAQSPTILSENFNGATSSFTIESAPTSPPQCNWYYQSVPYTNSTGGATFSNFSTIDGGKFALSDADAGGSGSTTSSRLISPAFSTVGFYSVNITFEHCYRTYYNDQAVALEISTDGGTSWSVLKNYKGTSVGNVTSNAQATAPENISLDPSYLNQPNLRLRFNYISIWGYFWIVDNVNITGTPVSLIYSWTPIDDLYLEAGAVTPYNGEDVSTVYAKIFTSETYTVTASTLEGCSVTATATVTGVDYTVSGTLKYNNNAKTAMNNVTLTLNPGGHMALTNGTGEFSFFDICEGNYTISIATINKPVGGINATDAVQMNVWNANQPAIQHVKFLAGETNMDGNISVTSTDALAVQNYFVYATPFIRTTLTGLPWVLWKAGDLITGNGDPNRLLTDIPVSVVDDDVTIDLYSQAIGDFSGSFTPGNLKGESDNLELVNSGTRIAGPGIAVDLPVTLMKSSAVSAVSLILDFPSGLAEITGVSMAENDIEPSWTVVGNELRIGWNSTQPLWIKANEVLLTIRLVTSKEFGQGDAIRFSLAGDPLNELADGNFEVIPGAIIGIDAVEFSAYGIGEPSEGNNVALQARPNPFMDYTTLTYGIPSDGHVTIQISDLLGRIVSLPVDEYKNRGTYSYNLDVAPLQPGVYTATITLQSDGGDMVRTIKLIRK